MPDSTLAARDALRLRAWALRLLTGHAPALPPPPASVPGWELFLKVERCALALVARLGREAEAPGYAALRRWAALEAKRVLAARSSLLRVGAVARARGWTVVVLKGGLPVLERGGPDLLDLDLLVTPEVAEALAGFLEQSGYHGAGPAAAHRLAVRAAPGELPIEIHTSAPGVLDGLPPPARLRPTPQPGLWALAPADHLLYLLYHSTVQHPERRGSLRDLLVLVDGLARCTPAELAEVATRVQAHRRREVLAGQLHLAQQLARGRGAGQDPYALIAAGNYVVVRWSGRSRLPYALQSFVRRAAVAAVVRRSGSVSEVGAATLDMPSGRPLLAWLRRHLPPLERALRRGFRVGPEWVLAPVGAVMARAAARAVAAAR